MQNVKEVKIILSDEAKECIDLFINALSIKFDTFVMYQNKKFYFKNNADSREINNFTSNFTCEEGTNIIYMNYNNIDVPILIKPYNPSITENPEYKNCLFINRYSGELFFCENNLTDQNVWINIVTKEKISPPSNIEQTDFFGNNSGKFLFMFDDTYTDIDNNFTFEHYNTYFTNGIQKRSITSKNNGYLILNDAIQSNTFTFGSFVYWNGYDSVLYDFGNFQICTYRGYLGVKDKNGFIGTRFYQYRRDWAYVIISITNNNLPVISINGEIKELQRKYYSDVNIDNIILKDNFSIFGDKQSKKYLPFGNIDRLRGFTYNINVNEHKELAEKELQTFNTKKIEIPKLRIIK